MRRYFQDHVFGPHWVGGKGGRMTGPEWWTFPLDLQMVELGARASLALDLENE